MTAGVDKAPAIPSGLLFGHSDHRPEAHHAPCICRLLNLYQNISVTQCCSEVSVVLGTLSPMNRLVLVCAIPIACAKIHSVVFGYAVDRFRARLSVAAGRFAWKPACLQVRKNGLRETQLIEQI